MKIDLIKLTFLTIYVCLKNVLVFSIFSTDFTSWACSIVEFIEGAGIVLWVVIQCWECFISFHDFFELLCTRFLGLFHLSCFSLASLLPVFFLKRLFSRVLFVTKVIDVETTIVVTIIFTFIFFFLLPETLESHFFVNFLGNLDFGEADIGTTALDFVFFGHFYLLLLILQPFFLLVCHLIIFFETLQFPRSSNVSYLLLSLKYFTPIDKSVTEWFKSF